MSRLGHRLSPFIMAIIALMLMALALATQHFTADTLQQQQVQLITQGLQEALGNAAYDNILVNSALPLTTEQSAQLGLNRAAKAYLASWQQQPVAIILPVMGRGYGGDISLWIGVSTAGNVLGFHILKQQETIGLGAVIADKGNPWLATFIGKKLEQTRWSLKQQNGDIDQIAGATVTSQTLINEVKAVLAFYAQYRQQLLTALPPNEHLP